MKNIPVNLKIIGIVHSPYKKTEDVPRQNMKELSEIEIFEEYKQGLKDIEGFTHLHIFFWLHKSVGYSLHVNTPWDDIPHGLFTTRSPHRPNPIAHTIVELIEQKDIILKVFYPLPKLSPPGRHRPVRNAGSAFPCGSPARSRMAGCNRGQRTRRACAVCP